MREAWPCGGGRTALGWPQGATRVWQPAPVGRVGAEGEGTQSGLLWWDSGFTQVRREIRPKLLTPESEYVGSTK